MKRRFALAALLVPLLGGCIATKQDLQRVQTQMDADRAEQNRQIQVLIQRTQAMLDSLSGQNARLRADMANRLLQIDRQLVQVQALSGQSQQQIRDLQSQLEQRAAEARRAQAAADSIGAAPADTPAAADRVAVDDRPASPRSTPAERSGADRSASDRAGTDRGASTRPPSAAPPSRARPADDSGGVSGDEAYTAALGAYRRGSLSAARDGFQEFLRVAPGDPRASEAQFYIGETYTKDPDAAIAAYQKVVDRYPTSTRAPTALMRMARLEIARGDRTAARTHLNQIVRAYPRSDEADEARTQLGRLGGR